MENKIEFNWEKYQSGEYHCITRDGRKVEQLVMFKCNNTSYPLCGVVVDELRVWSSRGTYLLHHSKENESSYDLFLIQKVKEEHIVEANETIIPELKGVLMEVSDDVDFRQFAKREVLAKFDNKYIVISNIGNIVTYKYARPIKEVKECWVNVYEVNEMIEVGASFKTKEEAEKMIKKERKYIKTICITNELEKNEH